MLWVRAVAALVFAPLFLLAIQFFKNGIIQIGPVSFSWPLFTLCLIVAFFGLWEYFAMASKNHLGDRIVGITMGMILVISSMLQLITPASWALILPIIAVVSIVTVVFNPLPLEEGIKRTATILFGTLYGGLFISFLYLLSSLENSADAHFWGQAALFTVWGCDTGAYCFGRTLGRNGKHKFAPNLSPKKSWEGFWGGVISSILVALFILWLYEPAIPAWQAAIIGLVASIFGPIGDLAESLLKRSAGVKDSGKIIPGHGGVLDRFDAVIFVAPIFYIIYTLFFA